MCAEALNPTCSQRIGLKPYQMKLIRLLSIVEVTPATATRAAMTMMEMKTRYWGDSRVLVFGRVLVMVNWTTNVGKRTEISVFKRSVKSCWGMRKQANPIIVSTMGGTTVCSVKNSLHESHV